MATAKSRSEVLPFKPRARLMLLLGDQLIKNAGIAVFELVKNAYDADSPEVHITMQDIDDPTQGRIIVEDTGTGMDYNTLVSSWLEPGTDFRAKQRAAGWRTPRFRRLPLGEKGVGRFAAHKLGNKIDLITRKQGEEELRVRLDWSAFETEQYLHKTPAAEIARREPKHFKGPRSHGTRIEISELREPWTRGMARRLARAVTAISSPFHAVGEFQVMLGLGKQTQWLEGLLTVRDVLEYALYRGECQLKGQELTYSYEFTPYPALEHLVAGRKSEKSALRITDSQNTPVDLDALHIGPVTVQLYVFDREPRLLKLGVEDRKGLRDFLDESGGVRVYRDGIRVYDYGEQGNDWLNLSGLRINVPTQRISNNLVLGAVHLDAEQSVDLERRRGLIEKTNREGFVENPAYEGLRAAVYFAVTQIEAERNFDKERIRKSVGSKAPKEPVLGDLLELRRIVEERRLTGELGSYLDRIEADFGVLRNRFMVSASAGLSLAVVIHEVEKGISELHRAVERENASQRVRALAKHLADLIEGFGALIRKSGRTREKARSLISQTLENMRLRLEFHHIDVTVDVIDDFSVTCSRRLILSTLMNLIDNAIWWLDNKWGSAKHRKRIYVGATEGPEGPELVIADNGPGFTDPPEYLTQPFISRKPDGMGLGLHLAEQVMTAHNGALLFPSKGDIELPAGFDGAVVVLRFGSGSK